MSRDSCGSEVTLIPDKEDIFPSQYPHLPLGPPGIFYHEYCSYGMNSPQSNATVKNAWHYTSNAFQH